MAAARNPLRVHFPPANIQLRRAQLVLILVVLVPTVLLEVVGVLLMALGDGGVNVVLGILVLTLCTTGITGYVLGSIFLGKGASLARLQNDFVSAVSHELRTPITSIRLLIEGLGSDRLAKEEKQHVLRLLGQETDRLEKLVVRVLELSRMESGAHAFHKDQVQILDVVTDALAAFDAATIGNPLHIETQLEPGLVVVGDRETLTRAVVNLLINAWKYSGDTKQITITTARSRRWVELAVIDNGFGIPRDEQGVIFEKFARGEAATQRSAIPGYGLGLAFVRAIARAHRGKIEVISRPGHTEMKLRLRAPRVSTAPAAGPSDPAGASTGVVGAVGAVGAVDGLATADRGTANEHRQPLPVASPAAAPGAAAARDTPAPDGAAAAAAPEQQ